ncbi:thiolase family protein [Rhodohalobacter sulfatireducens]|uniref:acetyl-CoA C-acyltransferase n=1 Tax=Rhodohalobacter sulfatireducens TaxID=2911366 RepID=A0ABS9KFH5_9BACT|nr:thiolase family protein [Rhodohalobacter sulfatireducens]MCG2589608.1 thiolase family protein [Rhodohalobacter sulfatireducens]
MSESKKKKEIVFVNGGRTPFLRAQTDFKKFSAYDLGRLAIAGLIKKTKLDGSHIDHVYYGNVIQDINTSNVARESSMAAGLPDSIPATTLSMACISSNIALTTATDAINHGQINAAIVGGVEIMSDIPIRFRKIFRQKLLQTQKYKSPTDWLKFFKGLSPSDLLPEIPSISEFSTGETMGESCDKMAAKYGVKREEQDAYALRSHQLAFKATEEGFLENEIFPVSVNNGNSIVEKDNGVRPDTDMDKLAKLSPAFIKPHGTVTAGNSSFLTDGASAGLVMDKGFALNNGYKPKALIRSYTYVAQRPGDELLIGPAFAVPKVLDDMKLTLDDIDVFEFHEAFAGQMLTVLKALDSNEFAKDRLKRKKKVGKVPWDKLNHWGGSLSLGHPFAATGIRLVTTAANRLIKQDGRYALIAACAAGGQGHAMILERFNE